MCTHTQTHRHRPATSNTPALLNALVSVLIVMLCCAVVRLCPVLLCLFVVFPVGIGYARS